MTYDGVGNRTSETTAIPYVGQAPSMGRNVCYGYGDGSNNTTYSGDQMNLTGESSRGTGNNYTSYSYSLIYDSRGNPRQQSATSGVSNSVGANSDANADDQLTSTLFGYFNYDGNGNLILDYQKPLTFDVENRLLSGSIQGSTGYLKAATYDGDGLRTSKTNGSLAQLYFLNDGSTPVLEENAGGAVVTANGWGPDGWRMRYTPGRQYFAYTYDPQGNRVQRHSQTGIAAYDVSQFDAFGNDTAHYFVTSSTSSRYLDPSGFGGQYGYYTDVETGLVLLTHRYYDPTFGRAKCW